MLTCRYHRCRGPLDAIRVSRRYCSTRCRMAAHRARADAERLRACKVELVGRREAVAVIVRHEHLGTMGNSSLFFGLRSPSDRLLSLVGFGNGAHAAGCGCHAVLERGWTDPSAPRNSGSHLIGRALRYGRRYLGWRTVKSFSDPRFGEQGLLYRACGFVPYKTKHLNRFRWGLVDGTRVLSDRVIYRKFGSLGAARAAGATLVQLPLRQGWLWTAP
jgi:hypothetical protein